MITSANIYVAIKQRLESVFNNVQIKDIKTISAPCFYIECERLNDKIVANETIQTQISFNVVYFAENNELSELLAKEALLKSNFAKPLKVNNRFLSPTVDFEVDELDEYTLTMGLGFDFYQDDEVTNPYNKELNNEMMNTLSIKVK